jgi:uncharacterized protein YegP (UPF0339 family)
MERNRVSFEIFSRFTIRGRRWYFRMKAGNGETIAQSEGYTRPEAALDAVTLIQRTALTASVIKFD